MGYNLLINEVYWGYNPFTNHLLTSWDIQVHEWLIFWGNVGKYTIHGSYGYLNNLCGTRMSQSCSFFLGIRSAAECGFPDFTFCLPGNSQLCGRGEIDEVYGTA